MWNNLMQITIHKFWIVFDVNYVHVTMKYYQQMEVINDIPHTGSRKNTEIELFHVDLAIKNEDLPAELSVIQ